MLFSFYFHHTEWQLWLKEVYSIYSSFSIWCQRVQGGAAAPCGMGSSEPRGILWSVRHRLPGPWWWWGCSQPWLWLPHRVSVSLFFLLTPKFFTIFSTQLSCCTNLIFQPPGWSAWAGVWSGDLLWSAGFLEWLSAPHIQNSVSWVFQSESMIYLMCF